jgi:hypothetical protein
MWIWKFYHDFNIPVERNEGAQRGSAEGISTRRYWNSARLLILIGSHKRRAASGVNHHGKYTEFSACRAIQPIGQKNATEPLPLVITCHGKPYWQRFGDIPSD